ncbi:ligase-associated DNA damage response endonuclease PdeM [Robiginitalea sp. IMCC43444]|uniref:ligase-associated DNA damage response endonuclease PdeM n=1 Tax=Robiginitalea sp. IMCC43444 TaxID=3459121 RepID=UPI0040428B2F
MVYPVDINGEAMELHPWGALFWKDRKLLVISDVHLGKIMHFRKYGAAVPQAAIYENFKRLDVLYQTFQPETICFLGDLFHSHINKEWELFEQWVSNCPAALELIVGNHDIISPLRYEALGVRLYKELQRGPFTFTHHPTDSTAGFNISGHIHPAVRLGGHGRQRLRLSCFFLRQNQLILPAFGNFTGSHVLELTATDRAFALAEEEVIPVSS